MFPRALAGRLHPNAVMDRLLGVNLLGARNLAVGGLVLEWPPSLVADGHAEKAAEPWARYAGRRVRSPSCSQALR
jgi:hypothetical protein